MTPDPAQSRGLSSAIGRASVDPAAGQQEQPHRTYRPLSAEPLVPLRPPGFPAHARMRDRPNAWHWLLAVPVVVALATPLYNHLEPRLLGMPFFYWGQIASVLFGMAMTTFVYQLTKRR